MPDETTRARQYFEHMTGVDITGHATESNGRFRLKPEDLVALADELATLAEDQVRYTNAFRLILEGSYDSPSSIRLDPATIHATPVCVVCGRAVAKLDEEGRLAAIIGFTTQEMRQTVHMDRTPVCRDWIYPVLREVEQRLREFDREGRERGLPGPLERDPSEPIVVEVTWCRTRTE